MQCATPLLAPQGHCVRRRVFAVREAPPAPQGHCALQRVFAHPYPPAFAYRPAAPSRAWDAVFACAAACEARPPATRRAAGRRASKNRALRPASGPARGAPRNAFARRTRQPQIVAPGAHHLWTSALSRSTIACWRATIILRGADSVVASTCWRSVCLQKSTRLYPHPYRSSHPSTVTNRTWVRPGECSHISMRAFSGHSV